MKFLSRVPTKPSLHRPRPPSFHLRRSPSCNQSASYAPHLENCDSSFGSAVYKSMQYLRKNLLLAGKSFSEGCPEFFRLRGDQLNVCVSQCQDRVSASFGRRFASSLKHGDTICNDFSPRIRAALMSQTGARLLSSCPLLNMGLHRSNMLAHPDSCRLFSAVAQPAESSDSDEPTSVPEVASHIKFKRPDKTARHIMQILDKEAVEQVKAQREIPEIKPGYIVQLKVEVPENKRRVSQLKGIIIAMRNAGLNTTFRIRRLVAGVGVESVYPLYSPNIKEIKVLDKKKVRRAKLYYLRDKLNALKK